mmetsp:Transcript_18950/g.57234  ORF Transcript_18950/g.57234 Transcript_18950/m.57234 type:complete len:569 (-) Transcript_18950:1209-2915(-)
MQLTAGSHPLRQLQHRSSGTTPRTACQSGRPWQSLCCSLPLGRAQKCQSLHSARQAFGRAAPQLQQPRRGEFQVRNAMFDAMSGGLERAWDMVRKDGKITPENIKAPMREIRRALLEADVSLPVVRRFMAKVEEQALGVKVLKGVTPDQQLVKVVNDQLIDLMGGTQEGLVEVKPGQMQVILMAGLQGVGKTTACGKLALYLKGQGKKVSMVATDVYRPAAIDQLVKLGKFIDVPVFDMGTDAKPAEVAAKGVAQARKEKFDAVIVDTAGRLQIDDKLMGELAAAKKAIKPTDTLLVVDAMTGQEAATLTRAFNEAAPITGAILTKMDGDSRGGAALSVREVSGKPIKFIGSGEKMQALELFYPDRIASRILGMGDILTLVEKAEAAIPANAAERMTKRMMAGQFDLNDFVAQAEMLTKMGPKSVMQMIPGMGNKLSDRQMYEAEQRIAKLKSMVDVMEPEERENPDMLMRAPHRRRRIARESEKTMDDVMELLQQYGGMRQRMKQMSKMMQASTMNGGMPSMKFTQEEMAKAMGENAQVPAGMVRRKKTKTKMSRAEKLAAERAGLR